MQYAQAVAKVRSLSSRSEADQWEMARLTYEFTTGEGPEVRTLTQWSADCGFSETHANYLRRVWALFGPQGTEDRSNLSFNECYTIASKSPTRAKALKKEASLRHRSVSTVNRDRRGRDPRGAFDDLREAMHDRKRRRRLLDDPEIRELVRRDMDEMRREREEAGEPMDDAVAGILEELSAIHHRLLFILKAMVDADLSQEERAELLPIAIGIRDAMDWMLSHLNSDDVSFEDALEAMLDGAPPTRRVTDPRRPKRRTPKPKVVPIAPADETPEPAPAAEPALEPATPPPATPTKEPRRGPRRRIPARATDPTKRRAHGKRAG